MALIVSYSCIGDHFILKKELDYNSYGLPVKVAQGRIQDSPKQKGTNHFGLNEGAYTPFTPYLWRIN